MNSLNNSITKSFTEILKLYLFFSKTLANADCSNETHTLSTYIRQTSMKILLLLDHLFLIQHIHTQVRIEYLLTIVSLLKRRHNKKSNDKQSPRTHEWMKLKKLTKISSYYKYLRWILNVRNITIDTTELKLLRSPYLNILPNLLKTYKVNFWEDIIVYRHTCVILFFLVTYKLTVKILNNTTTIYKYEEKTWTRE